MASSTFNIKDQNGNIPWGITCRIARGHGSTNQAEDEKHLDKAGHVTFLEVKKVLPSPDGHSLHLNFNEGFRDNWQDYDNKSIYYSDIEDVNELNKLIVLPYKGVVNPPGQPPTHPGNLTTFNHPSVPGVEGYGTAEEWKAIAHKIVTDNHLLTMEPIGGPQRNLQKFDEELKKVHPFCELQRNSSSELKPRIFLPSSNRSSDDPPVSGRYSRIVDIGDFGFPFFNNSHSSDEWQLTGRPPGSRW